MNLYELSTQYFHALDFLTDPETSADLPEEVWRDTLEGLEGEFNDKAIAVAKFIGNMSAEIDAMKEAERRMRARRETAERQHERLRAYLKDAMEKTGIDKISCPYFVLSLAKCPPSVEIVDISQIPNLFIRTKTIYEPDKDAIKKAGGCPGAVVVTDKKRLSIR
jgi:hypothetical protein